MTTKELTAIKEQLSIEQAMIKKYKSYAQMCADPEIRTKFENFAAHHENHYNMLITQLK